MRNLNATIVVINSNEQLHVNSELPRLIALSGIRAMGIYEHLRVLFKFLWAKTRSVTSTLFKFYSSHSQENLIVNPINIMLHNGNSAT